MANYSLLPNSKLYSKLLIPFFLPYALYTGVGVIANLGVPEWGIQLLKFASVLTALLYFRKNYTFGKLHASHVLLSAAVAPFLIVVWHYPLRMCLNWGWAPWPETGLNTIGNSELYFYLRLANSVFLVALLEELFCRVYLMEYFHQAGKNVKIKSLIDRLLAPLDERPSSLQLLPFSLYSIIGATVCFSAGHSVASYISAVLYFSLTNVLYWRTKSLWVCIFTHAFTNLGIAILVKFNDELAFLWF